LLTPTIPAERDRGLTAERVPGSFPAGSPVGQAGFRGMRRKTNVLRAAAAQKTWRKSRVRGRENRR